jgi:hypothetical protein
MFAGVDTTKLRGSRPPYGSGYAGLVMLTELLIVAELVQRAEDSRVSVISAVPAAYDRTPVAQQVPREAAAQLLRSPRCDTSI